MMFRFIATLILFFLLTYSSHSEIVKKINVNNNDRVSEATIINFSQIKVGQDIGDNDLNNIIKNLYNTNFFSDVKAFLEDGTLVITVKENKIIQSITINGLKAKKFKEAIYDAIKLREKSPYNEFLASEDLNLIKDAMYAQGFYFSKISSFINENDNNTIDLIYEIDLGEKALLTNIEFTGNKIFKSRKLRNIITSEEDKFWKFISSKKFLNKRQIQLDERLLKSFYLNNGYYNVNVTSVFAQLLDQGGFKLVFNIDAGNIYKINKTKLVLPQDYDVANFQQVNEILKETENETYSFNKISKVVDQIDKITLKREYEFINASINFEEVNENLLNLTIEISESEKKYVERINILGNNITEERVLRDQLEVDEGDPFNKLLHAKSINNLKSLNIFKKVETKVVEGSTPEQKIIDLNVVEKPTGEISLGAGVGTDGSTVGFSVSENNYMGKGIKLRSSLRLSTDTIRGQFTVVNPNYKYTDKSLFTNVQSIQTDKLATNGYKSTKTGFSVGTNFEQYDSIYLSPKISSYYESLTTNSGASSNLRKQEGSNIDTNFSYAIDYDKRNQRFMTTEGFRSTFDQSLPLLSDTYSIINGYQFDIYKKLDNDMITNFSVFTRAINSLSDKDVRVSNRLSLPSKKLRGFEYSKIGPVDSGDYIGGNYAAAINVSTTLPMFLQNMETADVSYFIDIGNVWGVDYSSSIDDSNKIRSSSGILLNWFTPIGPLNFSLAQPITKANTDKTQSFQFNLGTTF